MSFNWFRRQHDAPVENSQVEREEVSEQPEIEKAEPQIDEQRADGQGQASEDYLSWAKIAYENIRKRQQAQESEGASATDSTTVPRETTTETEQVVLSLTNAIESVSPKKITNATDTLQQDVSTNSDPESSSEIASTLIDAEGALVSATVAPLPFWAQAEADRQARLERLKANAIDDEATAVLPAVTVAPDTEAASLLLDEGFLWSSGVLAAQGRRAEDISIEEITWLKRLRQGLDKTRRSLINQLRAIVGQGPLNQDAVHSIEDLLLQADVGIEATDRIIGKLQQKLREEVLPPEQAIAYLKEILREMLDNPAGKPIGTAFAPEKEMLNIWLITGVNGAGKTTTIGKLAHIAQKSGYHCLIGAADTFRAAAVEQVRIWGQRSGVEVIANPGQNTDPAAVVFDSITAARSRGTELLLIDTAGRLQNKKNLMDELNKVRRIIDKKADNAKIESLLVLDATLGQNGLRQAEVFLSAAQLTGVVLTKLDGTAKGGIALAIVQQLGLPIRFIGAGEGIEDLRPFSSYEFVEALLSG